MPHSIGEWRGGVYHPSEDDGFYDTRKWKDLRRRVLNRDTRFCLRCDKQFPASELSVHHMIPRLEGGADVMENLVTLDNQCHDYVEINNLRTRADIMGSIEALTYEIQEIDYSETDDPYHKEWWHKYVYGGMRRGGRK